MPILIFGPVYFFLGHPLNYFVHLDIVDPVNEASEPTSLFIIFTPRIKASLSHTALESVRSGTAVKKIRSSASLASAKKLQNQENKSDLLKSNSALKVQRGSSSSTSKLPPPVPFKMDTSRYSSNGL